MRDPDELVEKRAIEQAELAKLKAEAEKKAKAHKAPNMTRSQRRAREANIRHLTRSHLKKEAKRKAFFPDEKPAPFMPISVPK